ncbi:hypothetical protein OSTOST_01583, partial [Ostertagia ostertagi]
KSLEPAVVSDTAEQDEVRSDIALKKKLPGDNESKENLASTTKHPAVTVTKIVEGEEPHLSTPSSQSSTQLRETSTTEATLSTQASTLSTGEFGNNEDAPGLKVGVQDETPEFVWNMTTPETLIEKVEFIQSRKDLPERWRGLVLRLKKKLEALKAQKEILKSLSTSTTSSAEGDEASEITVTDESSPRTSETETTSTATATTTHPSNEEALTTTTLRATPTSEATSTQAEETTTSTATE